MTRILDATFDGEVFRPDTPPGIAPNTRVKLAIELPLDSDPAAIRHARLTPAESLERLERFRRWVHESRPVPELPPDFDRSHIYGDHD